MTKAGEKLKIIQDSINKTIPNQNANNNTRLDLLPADVMDESFRDPSDPLNL